MKSFKELNESNANELSGMFFTLTSSLAVLSQKLRSYHQNVVGKDFFPVHQELDDQYTKLDEYVDVSAELIRQINKAPAPHSMSVMLQSSIITEEMIGNSVTSEYIIARIVPDYSRLMDYCIQIVKRADDANMPELTDFAIKIRTKLSKYIWKLESATRG